MSDASDQRQRKPLIDVLARMKAKQPLKQVMEALLIKNKVADDPAFTFNLDQLVDQTLEIQTNEEEEIQTN